jgi:hypothetical protein
MAETTSDGSAARARAKMDITVIIALIAVALSGINFYRSFIYTKQQLDVTVTEVSYVTNQGELYMTVAFSNGGNRDAAVLRVEPALWSRHGKNSPEWTPIVGRVHADIAPTEPKMPEVIRGGGVSVVAVSAKLNAADVEAAVAGASQSTKGAAFLGLRVATMNSDGNLYLIQHPVARLSIDGEGRIRGAEAAIHKSLSGFFDLDGAPPGDMQQENRKTPFVWADTHY